MNPFEIESSIPVLRMLEEAKARAFYLDYLGYEVDWEHRFSPEIADSPLYLQISLGGSVLHLNGHADSDSPVSEVRIPVRKIEEFCASLREKSAGFEKAEVVDPRYEGRKTDLNLLDPSGNLIVFWQPERLVDAGNSPDTAEICRADKQSVWHPFTDMAAWCADGHEPLVIERGEGVFLFDSEGKRYLDGNSSIWTNIHGHNHPHINAAIRAQLKKHAHSSFLGTTNAPAAQLAERLVGLFPPDTLTKVFFTDDGSTAMECAMKMAVQFWQLQGQPERCEFAAFDRAYHGDTFGATALGGIATFHARFEKLGLKVHRLGGIEDLEKLDASKLAGIAIEPLIQGAAGMRLWPQGTLVDLRAWCDSTGVLLILDEVMTGFGRTGKMFACEHEGVVPDFIALAKGLTGGYMPLAATLTSGRVFHAFDGETFYYGHSYSGNPLGCAAALANLEVFEQERTLEGLPAKIERLAEELAQLDGVGEIRQCGLIAGIDLPGGDGTLGRRVCSAARELGLLTRPVLDTVVLMPPLAVSEQQITEMVGMLGSALT